MVQIITFDTVWAANSVRFLDDTVQIAPGATLTIEPGAVVRGGRLEAFGRLDVAGGAGNEVALENVSIALKGTYQQPARIDMAHAVMKGGSFVSPGSVDYGSFSLSDSRFEGVQDYVYVWYPTSDVLVERNVFVDSGGFSVGTSGGVQAVFRDNAFVRQTSGFAIENWASYEASTTTAESNSFLSTDRVALQIKPGGYDQAKITAENNYFGSSDPAVISAMVRDRLDSLDHASVIDITPSLSSPSPATPAVPVAGGDRDDVFGDTLGKQRYEGAGGYDVLALDGGRRGVTFGYGPGGGATVTHGGQTDLFHGVEEVRFADGRLAFDADDPAARVARLYEAALDRLPDQGGLNFWIAAVQSGQPIAALARGFLGAPEFRTRFGEVADDGAFVDRLYTNVLNRSGEAEGRLFWVNSLGNGTGRTDVLVAFSESAENKAGTAPLVQAGIWDRSEAAAEVARLYDTVFGRLPDVPGLIFWKGALEGGTATLSQMADAFTGSAEFRAQYGGLDNRQFADALYVNSLDRPADQAGLDYWAGRLDAGVARSAVVLAFSESAEHAALTSPSIQSENPEEFGVVFA